MDIHELRSFTVLAEQLHFGRAAGVLHLSQPALTKQIRKMEEELGSTLFDRGPHGTTLSALGAQWLDRAKEVVALFDQMMEQGMQAAAGETGRLRIGFGFHTLELVPRLVVKLRSDAPGIQITLRDMSTAEQIAALEGGQLDLAFARLPLPGSTDLETLPVIEDRLALILPEKPALPAKFRLADCRDRPFVAISQERSPGFHSHTLRLCAQHGFHPRIVQEVTEFTTALALVRAGLGLTIMPESFWTNSLPGLQRYRFPEKLAAWNIGATWRRKDTNPALKRFLDLLRSELARVKSGNGNRHRSSARELEGHAPS